MDNVLVSIITPAFNSAATIAKTIGSVLNQTYTNIEYNIMDGGSSDDTVKIAESYRAKFEEKGIKYQIYSEKDNGMYDAINRGIEKSNGVIVGNVNSDDYYEPDAVKIIVEEYKKEPYDVIYGDLRILREDGSQMMIKKAQFKKFASSRYWNHPTTFITKKVYNQEQYRCESMFDDYDLILRLRKKGCKFRIVNKVLSNFTFGGMSNEKSLKKMFKRIKLKYKLYHDNGYGILYYLEGMAIEIAKFILG